MTGILYFKYINSYDYGLRDTITKLCSQGRKQVSLIHCI